MTASKKDTISLRRILNQAFMDNVPCYLAKCNRDSGATCAGEIWLKVNPNNWWIKDGDGRIPCFVCCNSGRLHHPQNPKNMD